MLSGTRTINGRERIEEPCALLLGGFDGLHPGHASLLAAARQTGLPVALTSICGVKAGGDLFTQAERRTVFAEAGVAYVLEYLFTEELRDLSAEDFIRDIFRRANAQALFCGEDFRFGKDAVGTPALLKRLAPCPVHILPLIEVCGGKASVSRIKALLAAGETEAANGCLSGGFFVQGTVEHGREVGRTYGFPTLNVTYPAEKFPMREGVYGGTVKTPVGEFASIIHFGARPTFGVEERKVEAYLKGFSGDLYGATVRVEPKRFLREIRIFASQEELKAQLQKDLKSI